MKPAKTLAQPSSRLLDVLLGKREWSDHLQFVSFSADGRAVRSLCGRLSEAQDGTPAEAARQFLQENTELFNLPATRTGVSLTEPQVHEGMGTAHVRFGLEYAGLPVFQKETSVHFGSDRRIVLVHSGFPTIDRVEAERRLTASQAKAAATKRLGATSLRGAVKCQAVFYSRGTTLEAAYLVQIPAREPLGDFDVVVQGRTGEILQVMNEMNFDRNVTGCGSVYVVNPVHTPVTVEPLVNLTGNTPRGLFANVVNEDGSSAQSATGEFLFDPANTHFDEINAYYHVNRIHDFYAQFGHHKMDRSLKTVVHWGTGADRAFFSPQDDMIALGDGTKLADLAKDQSVIYHEYAHATLRSILNLTYGGESGAINEGQADYFACTQTGNPLVGDFAGSKSNSGYLRKIKNILHYPEAMIYEVHADGRIWAGVLWDVREAVGPQVADPIIFRSLFFLRPQDSQFIDGYHAVMAAERELFKGAYAGVIHEVFRRRGIATTPATPALFADDLRAIRAFRAGQAE